LLNGPPSTIGGKIFGDAQQFSLSKGWKKNITQYASFKGWSKSIKKPPNVCPKKVEGKTLGNH
jgi:hypothetical protein